MVQRPSELARFSGMRVLTNRPEPLQSFNCVVYAKIPRNTFFYGEGWAKFPKKSSGMRSVQWRWRILQFQLRAHF
jgi:hypothetical protein